MKSVKQQLQDEIEKRISKNRAQKEKSKDTSVESLVFEFFKMSDEAKKIAGGATYEGEILARALDTLVFKLRKRDQGVAVGIEWSQDFFDSSKQEHQIRGVSIQWSGFYCKQHSVDANLYIDIAEMMLY